MKIRYRGIYEDRFDTPAGMGTMIFALDCYGSCRGCFHQDMRDLPIMVDEVDALLDKVQSNPFCKCIVLGGFEWLDYQYDECINIIEVAQSRRLDVILYTRRYESELRDKYPRLFDYPGLYIKCGPYDETKKVYDYTSYGVPLATSNQYIIKVE